MEAEIMNPFFKTVKTSPHPNRNCENKNQTTKVCSLSFLSINLTHILQTLPISLSLQLIKYSHKTKTNVFVAAGHPETGAAEQKRLQERKRALLVLIHGHLVESGKK